MLQATAFYVLAALILASGVFVVAAGSPGRSVVFLLANFLGVAGLYVLLGAHLLAVIQVVVYAGAVVVLSLFVATLVTVRRPPGTREGRRRRGRIGVVLAVALLAELAAIALYRLGAPAGLVAPGPPPGQPGAGQVGRLLLTTDVVPLEIALILLLVAIVGAVVFLRRDV